MTRRAGLGWIVTIGVAVLALVAVLVVGALRAGAASGAAEQYDAEQLCNAATIIDTGAGLDLSARDQTIAVMTAMGESDLRSLPYGDWETDGVRNPDGSPTTSIGLFQQQDEWGSREERLDPGASATLFYRAMTDRVPQPERDALAPTLVAHRTQVNDDPLHYEEYWSSAVGVVEQLTAADEAVQPCN
ncbi:peptidase M23 [uncultured Microbacterium sp.]|uniref:peptidase M23 n=1 Tax=uncultured Microbacterium sp. TaxID=191216 RepID=UPI0028CFF195|nr:peptidase M23 [uncultured Microbacterium sp.]